MYRTFLLIFSCCLLFACHQKIQADLIVIHGKIYTIDSGFHIMQAMAIANGKILAVGTDSAITATYEAKETTDVSGQFIYPGFIDAHCHFMEYGKGLNECDLIGTKSWAEVVQRLKIFSTNHPTGWLIGRGWDQNDWHQKEYPVNDSLDLLFPGRGVFLSRVDRHAAIVNDYALKLNNIRISTHVKGGEVLVKNGKPTGVLIDNASDIVSNNIPLADAAQETQWFLSAQKNCFAAGLTGVHDCGLDVQDVLIIDSLEKAGVLSMRMNVMLSDKQANYDWAFSHAPIITDGLRVMSVKLYADGALGSRGACLLQPYSDRAGHYGFLLKDYNYYDSILGIIAAKGWQACTHAIGDSANRLVLHLYQSHLRGRADQRWRIEHAQVINELDFGLFGESGIVPSVQPTHATSDMYWAGERLGPGRLKDAYAYKQLLQQNGWIPLGTDFPVEDISPIKTFYAAVFRTDSSGYPAGGFQPENALSREEALRGMTTWAAKAAFEESKKGSLEAGKLADFIILDQDLLTASPAQVRSAKVMATYLGGIAVYRGEK